MKFNTLISTTVVIGLALAVAGCASIVSGGRQSVSIKSQPSDAKVTVFDMNGKQAAVGQSPAHFRLPRSHGFFAKAEYRIIIEKQGYKNTEVQLEANLNGWYFGNFLIGGLLGFVVIDPATGAMWSLSPKAVDKVLETQNASVAREEGGLVVMLRQDLPEALAGSLELLPVHQ
ncbi:MAG TPA: hypothetical protein VEC99_16895 [Clostridia bacterium]|nr:hypothetical protein [Clostridia bacterium]